VQIYANGIQMGYQLSGKQGTPVIMMSHALGTSLAMWEYQLEALGLHYQVLRYDTRGHGGSEAPAGAYTLEQLGTDAISLMDVLGIPKVHWVGISMGGMIGQGLALNHPDRLISLSLCDTAAIVPQEAQPLWQERIETARAKGMPALVESTLGRWFTPSYLTERPPQVDRIRQQFLGTPVNGYIGCIEAIRRLNYLDRLQEITTPTLIVVGENDQGTPVAASEAISQRIAGSRLAILPSAAHLSNIQQSQVFNRVLLEFLMEFGLQP
jgi:3-oxoadipate enol-lactonase